MQEVLLEFNKYPWKYRLKLIWAILKGGTCLIFHASNQTTIGKAMSNYLVIDEACEPVFDFYKEVFK